MNFLSYPVHQRITNVSCQRFWFIWKTVIQCLFFFFFWDKCLTYQNLQLRKNWKQMMLFWNRFSYIVFLFGICPTHCTMPTQYLWLSMWKRYLTHWYVKCVGNIPRPNLKSWIIFGKKRKEKSCLLMSWRFWYFKPFLEKPKPTTIDSFLVKPIAQIRNVSSKILV